MEKPTRLFCLFLSFFILSFSSYSQKYESEFVDIIVGEIGGKTEVPVQSGRVDILTDEYAIEVEHANKWKQSIGQAMWYGFQTNKQPGIILIIKTKSQLKYAIQLESALRNYGLEEKIKVWRYPMDFFEQGEIIPYAKPIVSFSHWMTISSKKRHNSGCRYFNNSNGRACEQNEGIACGVCGG